MNWKDAIITWEETEHPLDAFGVVTDAPSPDFDDDPLYARPLAIWRNQSLEEIVEKTADAAAEGFEHVNDPESASGFVLAVVVLNLIPVHVKIVHENEHAFRFLELLKSDDAEDYFLRSDLDNTPEIKHLIEYFLKHDLLRADGDKLVVQGRVLKAAFLKR